MKNSIKKIIRDLLNQKFRTITVIVAVFLGVFAVSIMGSANYYFNRDLTKNYLNTNPASFTITLDGEQEKADDILTGLEFIEDYEKRYFLTSRISVGEDKYIPLWLFIIDDFQNVRINTFSLDEGRLPIKNTDIVIEKVGKKVKEMYLDDEIEINLPGGSKKDVMITGFVHDSGQAPSWMEGIIYGYISKESVPKYMIEDEKIKIVINGDRYNPETLKKRLSETVNAFENNGIVVKGTELLQPKVHPHETQLKALVFLLLMFGILTLVLSSFLIVNMISAIMEKQIKEIGIMKAIGASNLRISMIYFAIIFIIGSLASLLGVYTGVKVGGLYAKVTAEMLNFEIFGTNLPVWLLLLLIISGIAFPIIAAMISVIKTSKITVREALNDYGIQGETKSEEEKYNITSFLKLPNTLVLALRNTFRRKGRLFVTLLMLTAGGALFLTAYNIQNSSDITVNEVIEQQKYNVIVDLYKPIRNTELESLLKNVDFIAETSLMSSKKSSFIHENKIESNSFNLVTIANNNNIFKPNITEGITLNEKKSGIIINNIVKKKNPHLKVGDKVNIKINSNTIFTTKIIGISREMFAFPTVYISEGEISKYTNESGVGNQVLVEFDQSKIDNNYKATEKLERLLKTNGINVSNILVKDEFKKLLVDHLDVIFIMLMSMSILTVIVGGIGLVTTISINLNERKKEIGILRATGVSNNYIFKILSYEVFTIAVIGWILSFIFAIPLSYYLGNKFYNIFFDSVINFTISKSGAIIWFVLLLTLSYLTSLVSTKKIVKENLRELLSYE